MCRHPIKSAKMQDFSTIPNHIISHPICKLIGFPWRKKSELQQMEWDLLKDGSPSVGLFRRISQKSFGCYNSGDAMQTVVISEKCPKWQILQDTWNTYFPIKIPISSGRTCLPEASLIVFGYVLFIWCFENMMY